MPRVTLLGLPEDLERPLAKVLRDESHKVVRKLHLQDLRHGPKASAVFISADDPGYRELLSELQRVEPGMPVIVVTRMPGTTQWLDALDAGAADYCGAPFERVQVRCIMNAVTQAPATTTAAS